MKGRVIANYGPKSDSTHNDGINIAVPQGTEVLAAEQGTVAYAGSELKGYGNLILIRHDNGYVTAYAHNEEIRGARRQGEARPADRQGWQDRHPRPPAAGALRDPPGPEAGRSMLHMERL